MKRAKGFRIVPIVISLLIFFSPAYFCYLDLSQANLFSSDISYESPDQDGLSMGAQSEFKGFVANVPSVSFFPMGDLSKWLLDFSCQMLSIDQKCFVLRC